MNNLKITIFGCSVALRIRPPEKFPNNKNYGQFLEEILKDKYPDTCIKIQNLAFSRATIREIIDRLEEYIRTFPNFFILNIGVPDASTREIPYWYAQILRKPDRNLLKKIFSFVHARLIKPFNPFFVKLRRKKQWIRPKEFSRLYDDILKTIYKETNAQAICLAINPANERVEKIIPGSKDSYKLYNQIIEEKAKKYNAFYINFDDFNDKEHYPDGIHFNVKGHQIVAERIAKIIVENYVR